MAGIRISTKWNVEERPDDGVVPTAFDMNIRQVATSDGRFYFLPDFSKKKEARRKKYQRRMARQVKESNRRKDTKKKFAKVSRKTANIRRNWIHQTTQEIGV